MFGSWFGKRRNPVANASTAANASERPADGGADGSADTDVLCAQARQQVMAGRADAALVLLDRAIELAPTAQAYADRGTMLAMLGRLEAAHADLQKAIADGYRHAATHATLGTILSNLQRWDEAHRAFDAAIALDSRYAFAYYNRAQLFAAQGAAQAAVADLRSCLELGPDPGFRAAIEERLCECGVDPASLTPRN